jgi:hypothetical protein
MSRFQPAESYQAKCTAWEFLPFRFERLNGRVLVTNFVGEHLFLDHGEFDQLAAGSLPTDSPLVRRLRAKHVIREADDNLPVELLAIKARTRYRRLSEFTALHILVASLRCEHSCPYCQVSRQSSDKAAYDMSWETASLALDSAFRSPSQNIKIEFQGGEPLLNFDLIEEVVRAAQVRNEAEGKNLGFVIATNLALLDDRVIDFCRANDVYISTSLDGPADLHNKNRPRPGRNSWELATAGTRNGVNAPSSPMAVITSPRDSIYTCFEATPRRRSSTMRSISRRSSTT